ncbi:hypothetical protein Ahy_A04g019568 [Arachis hypogaea]|uniref:BED-type domain-containing protein n=1 Tax=Arachis hypogaea TaxID=3818 RepID=A0A445DG92_ARAHY|nr:hypothetical protein Ahy_A04g019568 [Arachis hypogaea]
MPLSNSHTIRVLIELIVRSSLTSVQPPPRATAVDPSNNHLHRAVAVVPSKVLHHYLVTRRCLPVACSVESAIELPDYRGKTDPTWRYVILQNINGKLHYQCLFCLSTFGGRKINRMKKHLAKIGGDIKKCSKVLYDVEKEMEGLLKEIQKSKTSKGKVSFNEEGTDEIEDAIDEAIAQEEQQTPCQSEAFRAAKKFQPDEIDADLDQGGGGGSSSTFYAAPLAFSGPSSENEGDDINDANLQQVMEDKTTPPRKNSVNPTIHQLSFTSSSTNSTPLINTEPKTKHTKTDKLPAKIVTVHDVIVDLLLIKSN